MPNLDWIIAMSVHLGVLKIDGRKLRGNEAWRPTSLKPKPFLLYKKAMEKVCRTAVLEKDSTDWVPTNWTDNYLNMNTVRLCANLYRHGPARRDELGSFVFRQLHIPATQESLDMMNRSDMVELLQKRFSRFLWCLTSFGIVEGPPIDGIPMADVSFTVEITTVGAVALQKPFQDAGFLLI